jgi:hypothetical protein
MYRVVGVITGHNTPNLSTYCVYARSGIPCHLLHDLPETPCVIGFGTGDRDSHRRGHGGEGIVEHHSRTRHGLCHAFPLTLTPTALYHLLA